MYKINLNPNVATHFRNTINEYVDLSMKHEYMHNNKKSKTLGILYVL